MARLRHPSDKRSLFADFNPDRDVWIVSDLRTKMELQKELMKDRVGMPGDAILRGSELWTQLLKRYVPKASVLSKDWIQIFARTALGETLSPSDLQICVKLISALGSVFAHPQRDVFFQDLLDRDPSAQTRWGKVLPEAKFLFDQARTRGWILQEALAGVLTEFDDLQLRHPAPGEGRLFFDLGASLGASEAELIRRLSVHHEVVLLLPRPGHADNFKFLLQPGEALGGQAIPLPEREWPVASRQFLRFSGRVAEIKNAVAQVREWLDAGVPISKIGVITPNFEMDFPVLALAFQVEGVPLDRELSERVQTHRLLQKWSSKLRLWKADLEYADLVTAFQEGFPLRSEEFAARLKTGLFHEDLARVGDVQDRVDQWKPEAGATDLSGFFEKATELWVDPDFTDLEKIFESLNETTPRGAQLSTRDWIEWMEVQTARLESTKSRGGSERLAIVPLQSADSLQWTHRIFISMVDQLPDKGGTSLLNREEIDTLGWTHGFFLPHPEQKLLQFELEWSLLAESTVDQLSYPLTDWDGAPTSPQALWLAGRGNASHAADIPQKGRWDELQTMKLNDAAAPAVEQAWVPVPQTTNLRLSASSIQRYGDCPFIFEAEKILGLIDPPLVDLDMDRRQMGQLQHAYLEKLTEDHPIRFERSDAELGQILEDLNQASTDGSATTSPSLWAAQKTKWIRLGQRFLAAEKAWFQKYPGSRIIGREVDFHFVYSPDSKTWRRGERESADEIAFTGRLDRVDGYVKDGELKSVMLYDYKASLQDKHGFKKWLVENEIQLGFYSWAMDQGLIVPEWESKVTGAIYYNLRTLTRDKGFVVADAVGFLADKVIPKDMSREVLLEFWQQLQVDLQSRMSRIRAGEFTPAPKDEETLCPRCAWKGLCRAPHLM